DIELVHDARWSNGATVTAADVRETVLHWKSAANTGQSAERWDLLDKPEVSDWFRARQPLRQGYLDPIALLTYSILTVECLRIGARDAECARTTVGRGTYTVEVDDASKDVIFKANPQYRSGRSGPVIREIWFEKWVQPAADFGTLFDILLDVPPA